MAKHGFCMEAMGPQDAGMDAYVDTTRDKMDRGRSAFVVTLVNGQAQEVMAIEMQYIGTAETDELAMYKAIRGALRLAHTLGIRRLRIHASSQTVIGYLRDPVVDEGADRTLAKARRAIAKRRSHFDNLDFVIVASEERLPQLAGGILELVDPVERIVLNRQDETEVTPVAHVDGACSDNHLNRGGTGACGVWIKNVSTGEVVALGARVLGCQTNNTSMYRGVEFALELARKHKFDKMAIRTDSELVEKQLNGEYRVKEAHLKRLYERCKTLRSEFMETPMEHAARDATAKSLSDVAFQSKKQMREWLRERELVAQLNRLQV